MRDVAHWESSALWRDARRSAVFFYVVGFDVLVVIAEGLDASEAVAGFAVQLQDDGADLRHPPGIGRIDEGDGARVDVVGGG